MRIGIGLLVVGGVIGAIIIDRHSEQSAVQPPAVTASAASLTSPRPPSQHNWPKSALDRANDVKRQVAEQRKQDGN